MEYRGETLDRATAAELADTHVMDGQRRRYVTVLPPYCSSTEDYVRVLAWRIVLCMLTLPVLVLSVVAQVVPYIHQECSWYVHVCFRSGGCPWGSDGGYYYYLVTQESSTTMYSIGLFPLCIVACVFALVLLALTITFAALWMWDESRRRAEAAMNRRVLRLYGRARADGCVDELSNLPYANKCVTNAGLVRHVPLEAREVARAKRDRDVGISIFSLYLVYLALDLSVVCIMFIIPDSEVGYWCVYESKKYTAGTMLSVIALGLGVLSVVLVAVPQAANLSLCCPRRVTRCLLMIAYEEDEAIADAAALAAARLLLERHHAAQAQQHHGAACGWPVQSGSHDNSGIPVAHPLSPHVGGDGGASEMASVPAKEKNLAFQYNVYVGDSP